ncbi:Protein of unknown function [Gryllus bimaculatus]|nr:Protein of unknown function [Gryllus bimaculatus]
MSVRRLVLSAGVSLPCVITRGAPLSVVAVAVTVTAASAAAMAVNPARRHQKTYASPEYSGIFDVVIARRSEIAVWLYAREDRPNELKFVSIAYQPKWPGVARQISGSHYMAISEPLPRRVGYVLKVIALQLGAERFERFTHRSFAPSPGHIAPLEAARGTALTSPNTCHIPGRAAYGCVRPACRLASARLALPAWPGPALPCPPRRRRRQWVTRPPAPGRAAGPTCCAGLGRGLFGPLRCVALR